MQINLFIKKIQQNIYYKKLIVLRLKYIFLFLGIFILIFILQISLMYKIIIPGILAPLREIVTPEAINWLQSGFNRVIMEVYLWGFLFFSKQRSRRFGILGWSGMAHS